MTFADELRNSKGPQVPQLTKEQKAARLNDAAAMTITMLKEEARSMNSPVSYTHLTLPTKRIV